MKRPLKKDAMWFFKKHIAEATRLVKALIPLAVALTTLILALVALAVALHQLWSAVLLG